MLKKQQGYIATLTVLIIMAVVIATATTVTYLSIGEAQSGFALFKGEDTLSFVEGCVEDVLLKVRLNPSYNGTTIMHNGDTCSITYNPGGSGPTNWDLTVSPSATSLYQRKIQVIFTRTSPSITLTSWKEV